MINNTTVSIVLVTYNRRERLRQQMTCLAELKSKSIEIIVVDNCSDESVTDIVNIDKRAILIKNNYNMGAVGRNSGLAIARGHIVITLDDDVSGISDIHIDKLKKIFKQNDLAAVNFKILEEGTGNVANWCHPYDQYIYCDSVLETNHISEGAVAFRLKAIKNVGFYPDYFFISHEGPDLAYRLINAGWRVVYSPEIVVTHAYEQKGRANWRRYYFDTRNQLWLVIRNLSFFYGLKKLVIGWGTMFVYSARDGYLLYWFKAVWSALLGLPTAWRDRVAPTSDARKRWREIELNKPSIWTMVRRRLFSRGIRI